MDAYPHLRIEREQPINDKRPRRPPFTPTPADVPAHAQRLRHSLETARRLVVEDQGGFDDRRLFKLQAGILSPELIEQSFQGVEIVSQEDGGFTLMFATEAALADFEARLSSLSQGVIPKSAQILYALEAFDRWTPEDRKGWALRRDGFPDANVFRLDVELWPIEHSEHRQSMIDTFRRWLEQAEVEILDRIDRAGFVAYRLRLNLLSAEALLNHRDVRRADLPPRFGLELGILQLDIQDIPRVQAPPEGSPLLAVLDSGIVSNHPLIGPALGDAQGFVSPERDAHDDHGHGTHVAGIALYGDVEECVRAKSFVPQLRLLSGRVLDERNEADPRFIENIVEQAVRYFHDNYRCRVYNLSYGDWNKPYLGGRLSGLAYTLDRLSRELDVLFVVPTGNLCDLPDDWLRNDYPEYLFKDEARLIDPAPALNAITVGSLARWDQTYRSSRFPGDYPDAPVAQRDQPSPFSRSGESVRGAVKPDVVAYGGNQAIEPSGAVSHRWLGELSTSKDFAQGRPISEKIGTSFAAPHVAHAAARLLGEVGEASASLLRALLVSNARIPSAAAIRFNGDEDKLARTIGYGMVDTSGLYRSTEEQVILIAESKLANKRNHFYEIPVPASFYGGGKKRRKREISVALAHCPPVRTTRTGYRASVFLYRLVEATDLNEAVTRFDKATAEEIDGINELNCNKTAYGTTRRSYGTVQSTTWHIKQPRTRRLFVVVTRNDPSWGSAYTQEEESYALVIRLADRENENARLYSEIRTQLQVRERIRQRVRA